MMLWLTVLDFVVIKITNHLNVIVVLVSVSFQANVSYNEVELL